MKKFYSLFLILLLITCSSNESSEVDSTDENQSEEIVFEQGFGKSSSDFVANWNKLVSKISSDEETLSYFSINGRKTALCIVISEGRARSST